MKGGEIGKARGHRKKKKSSVMRKENGEKTIARERKIKVGG